MHESQTQHDRDPFDLDLEIEQWVRQVISARCASAEALDELTDHLQCEIAFLVDQGVTVELAFAQATAKLGGASELRAEYQKQRRDNRWSTRNVLLFSLAWLGVLLIITRYDSPNGASSGTLHLLWLVPYFAIPGLFAQGRGELTCLLKRTRAWFAR